MQFTVFIIKIDHLPIASAAKNKTSTGKNFIFRTFPCKMPLSCNCKIEISFPGHVLKAQLTLNVVRLLAQTSKTENAT